MAGPKRRFVKTLRAFRADPVLFCNKALDQTPDENQAPILEALARGDRGIAVKSGHGVGKTWTLAVASLWWITVHFRAKAAVTAPSSSQLNDALLPEIKALIKRMPEEMQDWYIVKADRIELASHPELNFISAKTSRQENPDAMQGVHADHVLLIGDEASGIPETVYEASAGSMSSEHATMLLAGNPVRSSGYFYDCFTHLAETWTLFTINCIDSKRVSERYIEEAKLRYGEDSNAYRVRVLGEFPRADDDTVIPIAYIESAVERDVMPFGPYVWGLDPAHFGPDKTALVKRRSKNVTDIKSWAGLDTMEVVGRVHHEYQVTKDDERPEIICVDAIGLGAGIAERLRELKLPVASINVGESPSLKGQYLNQRAELWYQMREWFQGRDVSIPKHQQLIAELATVRYNFTPSNKVRVESKDSLRKRGVGSPDFADALMLTFAGTAVAALRGRSQRAARRKRNIKGLV